MAGFIMYSINSKKALTILQAANYFNENNISITVCAKKFGIHRETLANKLKMLNIYEDRRVKYKCQDNYFEVIDTEEKAYWLGFILADGSLHQNTNILSIGLSIEDIKHLNKFKKSISSNHPINIEKRKLKNKKYESARIIIHSHKIYNDLMFHNIDNHKSKKERYYELNSNLVPHYIRGIFDGDGWLSWNNNCAELGFGMGINILKYIKKIAEENSNVKNYNIKKYKSIYRYRITSKKR